MGVPIMGNSGEIKGLRSITAKDKLHNTIACQNVSHLHQASATPICHGEGYSLFHRPDCHATAKLVLMRQRNFYK